MKGVKVYLGSDHAGFEAKENLKKFLSKKKINFEDLGAYALDEGDDYPDIAFMVAERVSREKDTKGILICGSAEGMEIAANKVKGIRAVAAYDTYTAKMSRAHNDANVLALRARKFPLAKITKIVLTWLGTAFSAEDRHVRRLHKIRAYEEKK